MRSKAKTFNWRQSPLNCFHYKFYTNSPPQTITWLKDPSPNLIIKKGQSIASVVVADKEEILTMPFSGKVTERSDTKQGSNHLLFLFQKCEHVPIQGESKIEVCATCGDELFSYEDKEEIEYRKWDFKQIKNIEAPIEWNVVLNQQFTHGKVLGLCGQDELILDFTGRVVFIDNPKDRNSPILKVRKTICLHERIKDNICLECNAQVFVQKTSITVQPNGIINTGRLLEKLQTQFVSKLIQQKKLILILDLDNTILHAVSTYLGDIVQFEVGDALLVKSEFVTYIIKLRPFMRQFLTGILPRYDVYIYTKGTRQYAEKICEHIRQKYKDLLTSPEFDDYFTPKRITSRDQDASLTKKSLQNIIKGHENLILILDDRKDIWQQCRKNVVTTKQYLHYDRQQNKVFILPRHDFYLHLTTPFIIEIHKVFFNSVKESQKDVRTIIKCLQKQRMAHIKAFFLQNDLKTNPFYIRAINMGMVDVSSWKTTLPDIFIYSPKYSQKNLQAVFQTKVPIIHELWIEFCYLHNHLFERSMFDVTDGDFISIQNKKERGDFEKQVFEANKLFEEAILQYY